MQHRPLLSIMLTRLDNLPEKKGFLLVVAGARGSARDSLSTICIPFPSVNLVLHLCAQLTGINYPSNHGVPGIKHARGHVLHVNYQEHQ